jgi:methylenetetrahydrofolate reductase (NADPH)
MTPFDGTIPGGDGKPIGGLDVSFEFFPPKTEAMAEKLWLTIDRLAPLRPSFVSVTYGAGGSTRERTHGVIERLVRETSLSPAAHLTCVAATRSDVESVALRYKEAGVHHIVALRGDPPDGDPQFAPHTEGFDGSVSLIAGLRKIGDFEISAAAYPESHPDSHGVDADLDHLKRKIDAGASRLITQFFFDNAAYLRLRDRLADAGISVPLVPGILPVTNFTQVVKFAAACGASIPDWMRSRFEGLDEEPETRRLIAAVTAAEQCTDLAREGIGAFHFYTLNRAELTYAICHMLGIRADAGVRTQA